MTKTWAIEALPRIFVWGGSDRTVENEAANCEVQLTRLRGSIHSDPTQLMVSALIQRVSGAIPAETEFWTRRRLVGGRVHLDTTDRVQRLRLKGKGVVLWVSHDVDWVQLDDTRLWRFVDECRKWNSAGLVVARKIEPAVFALLKALGFQGLQYFSCWTTEGTCKHAATVRDQLEWIHLRDADDLPNHKMLDHVQPALDRTTPVEPESDVAAAIHEVVVHRFTGSRKPSLVTILRWWRASGLALPDRTLDMLTTERRGGQR